MPSVFFEPVAGASGDMILAALFDLGADPGGVTETLKSGGLEGFEIRFSRRNDSHHLFCGFCDVHIPHHHEHQHDDHHEHHHEHHHRGLADITEIIEKSEAPDRAKKRAKAIFTRLAEAEAQVHGTDVQNIHFHEVGAVDSIVDVFGICIALEQLGVDHIYCSGFKVGRGTVECAHGTLPVPAPATVKLLEGFQTTRLDIDAELTTPTGAAVLSTLTEGSLLNRTGRMIKSAMGHGTAEFEAIPNIIRATLVETEGTDDSRINVEQIKILESDLDDDSPETLAVLPELLRKAGALDAMMTPSSMKKGRLGTRLSVVTKPESVKPLCRMIFENSSTSGIRIISAERAALKRKPGKIATEWGSVKTKLIHRPQGIETVPEFESAKAVAEAAGVSVRRVMQAARNWETDTPG